MTSLKKKFILLALLIIVFVVYTRIKPSDISQNNSRQKPEISATISAKENNLVRTYKGTLPCDDCDGRETTLILTPNKGSQEGTYAYIFQRLGLSNASIKFTGDWTMGQGLTEDPYAKIIVTDPDDEETIQGYLVVDENQIEELDESGNRYASPLKYRLKLQK